MELLSMWFFSVALGSFLTFPDMGDTKKGLTLSRTCSQRSLFQFDAVSYSARKRAWSYLYKRTQHPDQVLTRTCSGPGQQQLSPDVLPESQPDTLFDTIQVNYGRLGLPRVWLVHHTTQLVVVPETRTKLSFLPLDLVETNPVLGKMAEFQTDRVQARKLRHRICYSNSAVL